MKQLPTQEVSEWTHPQTFLLELTNNYGFWESSYDFYRSFKKLEPYKKIPYNFFLRSISFTSPMIPVLF